MMAMSSTAKTGRREASVTAGDVRGNKTHDCDMRELNHFPLCILQRLPPAA